MKPCATSIDYCGFDQNKNNNNNTSNMSIHGCDLDRKKKEVNSILFEYIIVILIKKG